MINCLIVDDEPLARQVILEYLSHFPDWHAVKECINAADAWKTLLEYDIDVVFLDIQMPGIDGIEFLKSLKNPPLIIFVTAFAEYAVEGFDLMAVDYLLKPVTFERFSQAVAKTCAQLGLSENRSTRALTENKTISADHIFVKVDNRHLRINFEDLLFVEAKRDFSKLYLKDNPLLIGIHLKVLEEMLSGENFMRIHRSYIINSLKISSIEGNRVYIGQHEIPIGSSYKEDFFRKIGL